ncbi:MAG: redoxin domain-containing protein [Robiginitomaculum sp.]|nr:redoxin domain-containing protein [Robiginitomaculum sp.]
MTDNIYNYERFSPESYDFTKQVGLKIGDTLPAFSLQGLDGKNVSLNNFAGQVMVIETGSISCPLYIGKIKPMNTLVQENPDVAFLVIYIREAHPGKKIPNHQIQSEKAKNANRLKDKEPENRTILIDTLKGDIHKKLGLLPNMAYVIGADRKVLYRADWNIPSRIAEVLTAIKSNSPIPNEPADFTPVAPFYSVRVLARAGGLAAVWEFISHLPKLMKQHKTHLKNRAAK